MSQLLPLKNAFTSCPNFFAFPSAIYGVQNETLPVIHHDVTDDAIGIQLDLFILILGASLGGGGQLQASVAFLPR